MWPARGLLEYDLGGAQLHQYAVGRELPGSTLVALARAVLADGREPELILATAMMACRLQRTRLATDLPVRL